MVIRVVMLLLSFPSIYVIPRDAQRRGAEPCGCGQSFLLAFLLLARFAYVILRPSSYLIDRE